MGKHEPKEGGWIPAKDGFQVLGKATLKLLGKLTGWDTPGDGGPRTDRGGKGKS